MEKKETNKGVKRNIVKKDGQNKTTKRKVGKQKQEMIIDGTINNIVGVANEKEVLKFLEVEYKEINYSPLTKTEYEWVKDAVERNKKFLNGKDSVQLWNLKNKIDGTKESRPCTCKTSGHHWLRCIKILNNYLENIQK